MILRKPYAFLIKNFRLIHLLLTVLISLIFNMTNKILLFFNDYIKESTFQVINNISNQLIPSYIYLIILSIILINLAIIILLYKKDKPLKYYIITITIYILIIISLIISKIILRNIEFNNINILLLRITRDITMISYIAQIPILLISITRTIGFDIKKFNFKKDLIELNIEKEDNEEFELDVAIDHEDIKAKIRRSFRNFKYFYKENKDIILIILSITLIIIGFTSYKLYNKNKIYKQGELMQSNTFNIKVLSSYQTKYDYKGKDISLNKYTYIIFKINFENIQEKDTTINTKNLILRYSDTIIYYPEENYYDSFIDIGEGYKNNTIKSKENKTYIFIYKVSKEYETKTPTLEYIKKTYKKNNELIYDLLKLKPTITTFEKTKLISTKALKEQLNINEGLLKDTKLTINDYSINKNFIYTYENKTTYIVPTNKSYSALILKLEMDLSSLNPNITKETISDFIKLRCVIKGEEKTFNVLLNNLTPKNSQDIYLEVPEDINKATSIYLDFYIRDYKYTYILKYK